MRGEAYFRDLVEGRRKGAGDRMLVLLLTLLSFPYALALRVRAAAYAIGLLRSYRLDRPVVSVGNLTVGGTGKTPAVAFLARWYQSRGKRVAVLSRGYGGSSRGEVRIVSDGSEIHLSPGEAGDEPYLLATSLSGLMVVIGADRYRAGLLAQERLDPDIFILDDGFQHLRLRRDLNILLLDRGRPFGNGRTLPAGLLREPASAAGRADLVLYTRCGGKQPDDTTGKPFSAALHHLTGAVPLGGGELQPFDSFRKGRVMAFAGIADPEAFFTSLEEEGVHLVTTLSFPDHTGYGDEELAAIARLRDASRSDCLITTEKDAVKLAPYSERLGKVFAARLEIRIADSRLLETALEKLL